MSRLHIPMVYDHRCRGRCRLVFIPTEGRGIYELSGGQIRVRTEVHEMWPIWQ